MCFFTNCSIGIMSLKAYHNPLMIFYAKEYWHKRKIFYTTYLWTYLQFCIFVSPQGLTSDCLSLSVYSSLLLGRVKPSLLDTLKDGFIFPCQQQVHGIHRVKVLTIQISSKNSPQVNCSC